jgi:hypothetical protein
MHIQHKAHALSLIYSRFSPFFTLSRCLLLLDFVLQYNSPHHIKLIPYFIIFTARQEFSYNTDRSNPKVLFFSTSSYHVLCINKCVFSSLLLVWFGPFLDSNWSFGLLLCLFLDGFLLNLALWNESSIDLQHLFRISSGFSVLNFSFLKNGSQSLEQKLT